MGEQEEEFEDLWIRNGLVQQRMKKLFVNEGSPGNIRIMPRMTSSSFHIAKTFFALSNEIQVRLTNHCKGGCYFYFQCWSYVKCAFSHMELAYMQWWLWQVVHDSYFRWSFWFPKLLNLYMWISVSILYMHFLYVSIPSNWKSLATILLVPPYYIFHIFLLSQAKLHAWSIDRQLWHSTIL
jgi:hypothetical protein